MKFLIDAQLPRTLSAVFRAHDLDAIHTLDLPSGNLTTDKEIIEIAQREDRILVTKDTDFLSAHLLFLLPPKLIIVTTGNTGNPELFSLFEKHLSTIVKMMKVHALIEISKSEMIIHS